MKVHVSIQSEDLSMEELRALLQAIRTAEQAAFKDKVITIAVDAPEMKFADMADILKNIRPPYDYGPVTFKFKES
jgi:L-asparaginase/Glu-tRNA(Gln) amidotransferase subunit D